MSDYVKADHALKRSVIYTDNNGKHFRHFGGTVAWRNHNPGNIRPGKISKRHNQVGSINNFAVFPDYKSGHGALLDVIKTYYWNSSIAEMMEDFAPSSENNTESYIKFLQKFTGVLDSRKIKSFTPIQFKKLWQGIEKKEGWKIGSVVHVYKITATQINKDREICTYFLENNKWINKKDCIALARKHQVELEICKSKLGNLYLRTPANCSFQKDLHVLIKK